jgi:hypothetical protein
MIIKNDLKEEKNESDDGSFDTNLGKYKIGCNLSYVAIHVQRKDLV